jgi:hypothetical protein
MNSSTLSAYVRRFGNQSQKERIKAGVSLPDSEVDALIYKAVWQHFFGWYKRQYMSETELRDLAVMHRVAKPTDPVHFEVVEPADEFTEEQWTALKAIRQISKPFHAKVTPFWVIGHCGGKHKKMAFARVEFELDERPYKIELCLELPNHPKALSYALEMAKKEQK